MSDDPSKAIPTRFSQSPTWSVSWASASAHRRARSALGMSMNRIIKPTVLKNHDAHTSNKQTNKESDQEAPELNPRETVKHEIRTPTTDQQRHQEEQHSASFLCDPPRIVAPASSPAIHTSRTTQVSEWGCLELMRHTHTPKRPIPNLWATHTPFLQPSQNRQHKSENEDHQSARKTGNGTTTTPSRQVCQQGTQTTATPTAGTCNQHNQKQSDNSTVRDRRMTLKRFEGPKLQPQSILHTYMPAVIATTSLTIWPPSTRRAQQDTASNRM